MCSGYGWVYARAVPNPRRIFAGCALDHAKWARRPARGRAGGGQAAARPKRWKPARQIRCGRSVAGQRRVRRRVNPWRCVRKGSRDLPAGIATQSTGWLVERAVASPLAGHAVNPSLGARWRHPCRHTVPQSARPPPQRVSRWSCEKLLVARVESGSGSEAMRSKQHTTCSARNPAHRLSRLVLARPPSQDPTRHGCRERAYTDVLAACPARVGGQGPCSQVTNQPLCSEPGRPPSRCSPARQANQRSVNGRQ
ncbi:hypothetical protein FHY13_003005 [Xanthomonas arboricola]|nr:hypothetical protein [Xanthomonas euroxanthea]